MELDAILGEAVRLKASDIHMKVGRAPLVRCDGEVNPLEAPDLGEDDLQRYVATVAGSAQRLEQFQTSGDLDIAYTAPGLPRFRVNVFRQRGATSMVMRLIPNEVPRFTELGLPPAVEQLAEEHRGLILVTGATGSGKTTTLAAMLDHINRTRRSHIVTIEDPIEIVHPDRMSIVNQREVGLDTESFGQALRRALRQDPDTIMIGELRDAETAQTALQAAESGHLVLSTLHTVDAAETIGRMIEFFPDTKQQAIRSIMAAVLKGVVSQRLLPRVGGGRVAVVEAMVINARIADLVREGKPDEITDAIAEGEYFGMQTFEKALIERVLSGELEQEVAADAATSRHDFLVALSRHLKQQAVAQEATRADTEDEEESANIAQPETPTGLRLARAVDG